MDTMTFISKLIDAVAWPLATLAFVILLRKEIKSLLPYIKKLKAGPVEAEFDRELKVLASDDAGDHIQPQVVPVSARLQTLLQLAQINPRSAILEAWQGIELAIKTLGFQRALNMSPTVSMTQRATINSLLEANFVDKHDLALYYDLRSLRNQAAHETDFNPSPDSVLRYIKLSDKLITSLERGKALQAG